MIIVNSNVIKISNKKMHQLRFNFEFNEKLITNFNFKVFLLHSLQSPNV